jgi:hypothetical protein
MAAPAPQADACDAAVASNSATAAFVLRTTDWERAIFACDFASPDRPALVTELLRSFLAKSDVRPVEPLEIWNLAVSARHLWLVRIAAALENTDAFVFQLRCPHDRCRESMEVLLTNSALTSLNEERATRNSFTPADQTEKLFLRRPTGDDLRRWHAAGAALAEESTAQQAMLHDLIVDGQPPADPARLAEAFEIFDPLLAFTLTLTCPACGYGADHNIDLEAHALTRLHAQQTRLLHEVHRLALAYGWTESEILAVPAGRRRHYLDLIDSAP